MARFTENVDLPTPPLPLAIAKIFFASILNLLLSLLFVLVLSTSEFIITFTESTPEICSTLFLSNLAIFRYRSSF